MDYDEFKKAGRQAHNVFATSLEAAAKTVGDLMQEGCHAYDLQESFVEHLIQEAKKHRELAIVLQKLSDGEANSFLTMDRERMH